MGGKLQIIFFGKRLDLLLCGSYLKFEAIGKMTFFKLRSLCQTNIVCLCVQTHIPIGIQKHYESC